MALSLMITDDSRQSCKKSSAIVEEARSGREPSDGFAWKSEFAGLERFGRTTNCEVKPLNGIGTSTLQVT